MPFNPSYPADHVAIIAAEFREQFNALKEITDAQTATIEAQALTIGALNAIVIDLQTQVSTLQNANYVDADQVTNIATDLVMQNSAAKVNSIDGVGLAIEDPPSQNQ